MPKKKQFKQGRKHKKYAEDLNARSYNEDTSINNGLQANVIQLSMLENLLNYSSLKCLFSSKNGCYLSSLIEVPYEKCRTQIPHNKLEVLDLSYSVQDTKENEYHTPNRYSANCIWDGNNPCNKCQEKLSNNSKVIHEVRLNRLQNFNNIILNVSQGVNHKESQIDENLVAVSIENSFKLNCNSTSTPINKNSFCIQTNVSKKNSFPISRRKSYKSSPIVLVYCKCPQVEKQTPDTVVISDKKRNSSELCTWIVSKIKEYPVKYFVNFPTKFIDLCVWSGFVINRCLMFLYQLCINHNTLQQKDLEYKELMKEMQTIRQDILEIKEDIKNYFNGNKAPADTLIPPASLPPLPPPPPLPPAVPTVFNPIYKRQKTNQQKNEAVTKPIISLEDILKVKLKKVTERSNCSRRCTEPLLIPHLSNLKAVTNESIVCNKGSNDATSPCSSLIKLLKNVTTASREW